MNFYKYSDCVGYKSSLMTVLVCVQAIACNNLHTLMAVVTDVIIASVVVTVPKASRNLQQCVFVNFYLFLLLVFFTFSVLAISVCVVRSI